MDLSVAILLGIVQGIAEFLPISSSGHLLLFDHLLEGKSLSLHMNIALHLGTLLAVSLYFFSDWWRMLMALIAKFRHKTPSFEADTLFPALVIGSIPAGILGLLFDKQIEAVFHNPHHIAIPLILVGILMWAVDRHYPAHKTLEQGLNIRQGLWIGIAQCCALIPGVSRSGSTLTAGRFLGFSKDSAARFSFLLGTPPMVAAVLLHIKGVGQALTDSHFQVGVLASFIVGLASIHFLLAMLKRYSLFPFMVYRVALGIGILLWL